MPIATKRFYIVAGTVMVVLLVILFLVNIFSSGPESIDDPDLQEMVLSAAEEAAPTSIDLIKQAHREGSIDADTTLRLKTLAVFAPDRLPEAYRGAPLARLEGDMLLVELQEQWDLLDQQTREILQPLFLDPSEDGSYFHPAHTEVRAALIDALIP